MTEGEDVTYVLEFDHTPLVDVGLIAAWDERKILRGNSIVEVRGARRITSSDLVQMIGT